MKSLKLCTIGAALALMVTAVCQAAVEKAAFLQGSQVEGGGAYLDSATPTSIAWNERSSIDPSVFEHSINSIHQLKVLEDGDYIVAATMPVVAIDTPDNRPSQDIEIYVNGEPAPGSQGRTGYIRNQPRNTNMQDETSCHAHLLLQGLSAGDVIEVKASKTAQPAIRTAIQTASLFVEKAEAGRTIFSAVSDDSLDGVNLNPDWEGAGEDPVELPWVSNRKDSGISHSDGGAGISLSSGTYLVYVNLPLQRTSGARLSPSLEILLDGSIVPGGQSRHGYNRNASGHIESSVHFAGIVEVSGNQTLTTQTLRYANSGNTGNAVLPTGKKGSIMIEKIDNDGVFTATAVETTNAADPADWNAASKEQIIWESPAVNDSSTYNHSGEDITVRQAGDYLLVYNDLLQSTAQRPNPRITVEINGAAYPGAEAKTHYIRSLDGHNTASATMAILLEGLSANDVVTVSTQREGQTGAVGIEEFSNEAAILGLIKKSSLNTASIASAPRITSFTGDRNGFQINIQEFAQTVDAGSVAVTLNGQSVDVDVNSSGGVAVVSYAFTSIPDSGSSHAISVSYKDSAGGSHSADLSFTITDVYSKIPGFFANNSVDTNSNGFTANVSQISEAQSGATNLHGNNIDNANRQLQGGYSDADGNQYINEVGPDSANSWQLNPVDVSIVNFEQDGGSAGNFNDASGFTDAPIPGIPGFNDSTDGIAAEFLTYLELDQGWHSFGVNSDDGFQVTMGPATQDLLAASVGEFNGGRGSADSIFEFYVEESGFYPTRLLWFEGTGGANVEFFSVVDGEKILINDRDNPNATKAYSVAQTRPYVSHFEPVSGTLADEVAFTITNGNIKVNRDSVQLSVDGALVIPPNVKVDGNNITTSFKNPVPFAGGDHVAILTYTENSNPPVTRTVEHRFTVPRGMAAVLEDEPFAYWTFRETSGGQAFSELGGGIVGTYYNGPTLGEERLVPGAASAAVLFDASKGSYLDIPDHQDINNAAGNPAWKEKTIEIWFKARNLPSSDPLGEGFAADVADAQIIYEQGGATRGLNVYLRGSQPGPNPQEAELWFTAINRAEEIWGGILPFEQTGGIGSNGEPVGISTTIQANTVYHAVFVMNGDDEVDGYEGTLTGYLNGEQFAEVGGVHLLYNHTDDVAFGARNEEAVLNDFIASGTFSPDYWATGDLMWYDGWLDEAALYNTALSADRVKAHYEAGMSEVPFTPEQPEPPVGAGQVNSIALTDGSVVIEFEGTLKSSATANGQYAPVAGATSPYSVTPDQSTQFYIAE
jgi:hypothetical protein